MLSYILSNLWLTLGSFAIGGISWPAVTALASKIKSTAQADVAALKAQLAPDLAAVKAQLAQLASDVAALKGTSAPAPSQVSAAPAAPAA